VNIEKHKNSEQKVTLRGKSVLIASLQSMRQQVRHTWWTIMRYGVLILFLNKENALRVLPLRLKLTPFVNKLLLWDNKLIFYYLLLALLVLHHLLVQV